MLKLQFLVGADHNTQRNKNPKKVEIDDWSRSLQKKKANMNGTHDISADQFDINKLHFGEITDHAFDGINYRRIQFIYTYPDGKDDTLILAGHDLPSGGIFVNVDKKNGSVSHSMSFDFNDKLLESENPDDDAVMIKVLDQIHAKCCQHCFNVKDQLGFNWRSVISVEDMIKLIADNKRTKEKKIIPGRRCYAKLQEFKEKLDKDGNVEKPQKMITKFTDLNGKVIPYTDLVEKRCSVIPALAIEGLYIGAKMSIQTKLNQGIVVAINGSSDQDHLSSAVERYKKKNSNMVRIDYDDQEEEKADRVSPKREPESMVEEDQEFDRPARRKEKSDRPKKSKKRQEEEEHVDAGDEM